MINYERVGGSIGRVVSMEMRRGVGGRHDLGKRDMYVGWGGEEHGARGAG